MVARGQLIQEQFSTASKSSSGGKKAKDQGKEPIIPILLLPWVDKDNPFLLGRRPKELRPSLCPFLFSRFLYYQTPTARLFFRRGEMGEFYNADVPFLTESATALLSPDGRWTVAILKQVYDNVHGTVYLDPMSLKFIDTEHFQRLRDLKQLGVSYMVYPGAVHSRFEHSLGVYWLASQSLQHLQTYQGAELDIDRFDVQAVQLAGLLHDVGHGPFSHMFEHEFLPRVISGSKWSHESMSEKLVDYIADQHHIDIDSECLRKVKDMIIASSNTRVTNGTNEKRFLYDIVANGRNGIDVDKFDYIARDCRACGLGYNFQFRRLVQSMRVMDDEICYPAKEYLTVHKLFATRMTFGPGSVYPCKSKGNRAYAC
ncbi:hypothetical protein HPP92_003803 [Vanilla planifolia]|uniref:HD/PDEase domain-containing protein n=1 Tax=Vanilla planifolia TaxID=51239 RepID=A0A835S925_VANPL|nr:hypothetical protein HPP92_003803 [Vanilla planifolia]